MRATYSRNSAVPPTEFALGSSTLRLRPRSAQHVSGGRTETPVAAAYVLDEQVYGVDRSGPGGGGGEVSAVPRPRRQCFSVRTVAKVGGIATITGGRGARQT